MNTGEATSEQSTVWSRFWSWFSPVKTAAVVPSEVAEAPAAVAEVAPAAPEAPAAQPLTPPPTPVLQPGKSLEIPLDTKPLDVSVDVENSTLQPATEQPDKNDKHEEQPSQPASSAKSHQKKKKRH